MNRCNYCQPGAICPYHGTPEIDALRDKIAELEAALRAERLTFAEYREHATATVERLRMERLAKLCEHGINHAGERHGCDGCCKLLNTPGVATEES